MKKTAILGIALLVASVSAEAADWRKKAVVAADRLAERIEALDETLHEVEKNHGSPAFKKAVQDIHHIEGLVSDLVTDLPTAPFKELCHDFHHIYEDLVKIRLDLINLGLTHHTRIVRAWNNMANTYNRELNPYFQSCHHHAPAWTDEPAFGLEYL